MKLEIARKIKVFRDLYLMKTEGKSEKKLKGENFSFGELNPDIVFFVIKLDNPYLGLMSIYHAVLGYVRFALKNSYVPVVDMQNYSNGYLPEANKGKENAWEYFFQAVSPYTLEDVYKSKNVIIASGISPREGSPYMLKYLMDMRSRAEIYYNISEKNLRIRKDVLKLISERQKDLIGGKRVLGVSSRGTDILSLKGHSKQPSVKELIEKTKKCMTKWKCNFIYLATEENVVVEVFKNEFGAKLIIYDRQRIDIERSKIGYFKSSIYETNDEYNKGIEYLTSVYILSQCTSLLGSMVGATIGAKLLNRGAFENEYFFDLGFNK